MVKGSNLKNGSQNFFYDTTKKYDSTSTEILIKFGQLGTSPNIRIRKNDGKVLGYYFGK